MKSLALVIAVIACSALVVDCQFGFGFRTRFFRPFGFGFRPFGFGGFRQGLSGGFRQGSNGGFRQGSNGGFGQGSIGGFRQGSNGGFGQGSNGGFGQGSRGGFRQGSNGGFGRSFRGLDFNNSTVNSTITLLDGDDIRALNETDSSICVFSSLSSSLSCFSHNETFDCPVMQRFEALPNVTLKLTNLELVPLNNDDSSNGFRILERMRNFTFLLPEEKRQFVVSIKHEDEFSGPGLFVENAVCWSNIVQFFKEFPQLDFRLSLFM